VSHLKALNKLRSDNEAVARGNAYPAYPIAYKASSTTVLQSRSLFPSPDTHNLSRNQVQLQNEITAPIPSSKKQLKKKSCLPKETRDPAVAAAATLPTPSMLAGRTIR
jgi:hypothetical protein